MNCVEQKFREINCNNENSQIAMFWRHFLQNQNETLSKGAATAFFK